MAGQVWKVVGGTRQGGILVRTGQELSSPEASARLPTGALVRQMALQDERLCYELLMGDGPYRGWVSLKSKGNALLEKVPTCSDALAEKALRPSEAVQGRPARILALHGKCSNSNIMKVQCAPLKSELGRDFEWFYLDGNIPYDPELESKPHYVPTDFEKTISKGVPFLQWYNHRLADAQYEFVEQGLEHIEKCIAEQGPFDVVVSFSMASNVISMLLHSLRQRPETRELIPWRLTVMFNGGIPRQQQWLTAESFAIPTIKIYGGAADTFWEGGEPSMSFMYSNLLELGHEDGHSFPRTQPRAGEIYKRVAAEIRRHCHATAA